jgi:hypothetical protein
MTDDELRSQYQRILAARPVESRAACPTPDQLLALAQHQGTEEERIEALDHAAGCAACRRELDLLLATEHAAAAALPGGAGRGVPAHGWRSSRLLALAASLVLVAGGGWAALRAIGGEADVLRGDSGIALVAPDETVRAGAPVTLRWREVPGAVDYAVEVTTEGGDPVFAATTRETSATLPDSVRLTPGAIYQWWVRARLADLAQRRSAARRFRVQP